MLRFSVEADAEALKQAVRLAAYILLILVALLRLAQLLLT
jgi:hypothetical protein